MAATVHGASRFGIVDDSSATGLLLGDLTYDYSVDIVYAKNHIGNNVSMALLNDITEVSCSGVVAVKATGLAINLGSALTLANSTDASLTLIGGTPPAGNMISTAVANAGLIVSSLSLNRVNADFENGSIKAIHQPLIAVNSPATVT